MGCRRRVNREKARSGVEVLTCSRGIDGVLHWPGAARGIRSHTIGCRCCLGHSHWEQETGVRHYVLFIKRHAALMAGRRPRQRWSNFSSRFRGLGSITKSLIAFAPSSYGGWQIERMPATMSSDVVLSRGTGITAWYSRSVENAE